MLKSDDNFAKSSNYYIQRRLTIFCGAARHGYRVAGCCFGEGEVSGSNSFQLDIIFSAVDS